MRVLARRSPDRFMEHLAILEQGDDPATSTTWLEGRGIGRSQARPNSGTEARSGAVSSRTNRAAPSRPAYRLLC